MAVPLKPKNPPRWNKKQKVNFDKEFPSSVYKIIRNIFGLSKDNIGTLGPLL